MQARLFGKRAPAKLLAAIMIMSAVPMLTDCNQIPGAKNLPGGGGACPADIADASAVMSANFGLEGELEGKVKAALSAGAHLQEIAVSLEADVAAACGNLAKDLGATDADLKPKEDGPGKKAEAACNAAVKFVADIKAKVGAKAKISIDAKPPECSASMDVVADCAAKCDATVKPGSAKVECEGGKISGTCDAKCEGSCTVEAGAKCEGSCSGECKGECSAEISGKCDGTCNGKCDGKDSKAKCSGTCEGKCAGKAEASCSGSCKGECSASCSMDAKGECKGECGGKCSVEMKAPKCSGEVKPPEMSAECKANCDADVNAKLECHPASVIVKIEGAADAAAAAKLKAVFSKDLPAIFKVTLGMKGRLEKVMGNVQATIEGVQGVVSGGGTAALKVAGCFAASLKAQAEASASINVSVKASASASGSASTGG